MSTSNDPQQAQDEHVQALVLSWVRSLIREDEQVTVSLTREASFSTVLVNGSEESISILVGVKGQMARALRTLLAGASTKLGRRYALDLVPHSRA